MPLSTSEFVQTICIDQVEAMQRNGHQYLSALVMAAGVELLGGLLETGDTPPFALDTPKRSEKRFDRAIKDLFPSDYLPLLTTGCGLYAGWRCGGLHQLAPSGFWFIAAKDAAQGVTHLDRCTDGVVLICEELCSDYVSACKKVLARLGTNSIPNSPFLWVPGDRARNWSGGTGSGGLGQSYVGSGRP